MTTTKMGWVAVATYSTLQEAAIARGMLQDNGINAVIENGTISSVLPMTDTWAPLVVFVPAEDEQSTRKLLQSTDDIN
ncbi:MAG: DUF2007 domain-containing protein [Muribaculaceae bacterium]|nr:DUF2007 domain-containing protein [Muribaculaceae bacterium]